jgi:SAM-dependent methyltransferase
MASSSSQEGTPDEEKLGALKGAMLGGAASALLVVNMAVGDQLGFYVALGEGEVTAAELAKKTDTNERYVSDWLLNQTISGLVTRTGEDGPAGTGKYSLNAEQKAVLASPGGPHDMMGAVEAISGVACKVDEIAANVRSGSGLPWAAQHSHVHDGVRRFFAPLYSHCLVQHIVPALDGVEDKLKSGARVADIGCGHGVSTQVLGAAFPKSEFVGVDYHAESIAVANKSNTLSNVKFTTSDATSSAANGKYDLICVFDCFHDMSDPEGAAKHFFDSLADGGSVFLIEPPAGETIGENANILGRVFSGFSITCCLQCAMASAPGACKLGTVAPSARHREIFSAAGFSSFSAVPVAQAPTSRVFQVKK